MSVAEVDDMINMERATDAFVEAICKTEAYRNYTQQVNRIKEQPLLKEKIDEYRERNFELQNSVESEELFDKIDEFEKEYAVLRENPIVDDFLVAELGFCRLMQKIYSDLADKVDFE